MEDRQSGAICGDTGVGRGIVFRNHKISTKNLYNAFCFSFQIPKFQKIGGKKLIELEKILGKIHIILDSFSIYIVTRTVKSVRA